MVNHYGELQGGDDRKILAYALFHGYIYGASVGVNGLIASSDTIEELKQLPEVAACEEFYEWQIIDTSTFKVTDAGNYEALTVVDGEEQRRKL